MKTFDFSTLEVRHDMIPDYREAVFPEAREGHFIAAPPAETIWYAEIDSGVTDPGGMAARMIACINACKGLSLPEAVEPGILADLLEGAKELASMNHFAGRPSSPKLDAVLLRMAKLDRPQADAGLAAEGRAGQ